MLPPRQHAPPVHAAHPGAGSYQLSGGRDEQASYRRGRGSSFNFLVA